MVHQVLHPYEATDRLLVATIGEIVLRPKSPGHERSFQSPMLEAIFAGGEANVAASVANCGLRACYATALLEGPLSDDVIRSLRSMDVESEHKTAAVTAPHTQTRAACRVAPMSAS